MCKTGPVFVNDLLMPYSFSLLFGRFNICSPWSKLSSINPNISLYMEKASGMVWTLLFTLDLKHTCSFIIANISEHFPTFTLQDQITTKGTSCPTLCDECVGSLTPPADHNAGDGPMVYPPYPRRQEHQTICRCL